MEKLQKLTWLMVLLVGSSTSMAVAQSGHALMSEDGPESMLRVGISFEARGAYDCKNYYAAPAFGPAVVPMRSDVDNKKRSLFDITNATLNVEKELPLAGGESMKLVVQADLRENVALKSVYADFKGFRVGKAVSNFCDPDACGLVGGRFVQVRWQHQPSASLNYTLAIEGAPDLVIYPEVEEADRATRGLQPHKNVPAVSANVRYEQGASWHVQVGGLFRFLEYRNTNTREDIYIPTYGVSISTALQLVPERSTFSLQGVYGQGIGNYMADLGALQKEVNAVYATGGDTSKRETLDAIGVGAGITHNWLPELRSEAAYRFISTTDNKRSQDAYRYGHAASVNLFYYPTEQIRIGTEYLFCVRKNIGGEPKDAHRVQAVIGFEL
ncbi:MAG: porin [Amoebophilaceae bacterium]|nr:porin [Amoebophilaceae bacterium]